MKSEPHQSGFSLVELSIVLVILGLLVGGILGGQSLIRAAELRAVTTELHQWQTAINTFRQKYHALPGDFRQATRFWGDYSDPPSPATGNETWDGDNSGAIDMNEQYAHWQHLSNAGLIAGNMEFSYTSMPPERGVHVPASKFGSASWHVVTGRDQQDSGGVVNIFMLAGINAAAYRPAAILSPEDLWSIDSKMDDGMPFTGAVRSPTGDDDCVDTSGSEDSYNLGNASIACIAAFSYVVSGNVSPWAYRADGNWANYTWIPL